MASNRTYGSPKPDFAIRREIARFRFDKARIRGLIKGAAEAADAAGAAGVSFIVWDAYYEVLIGIIGLQSSPSISAFAGFSKPSASSSRKTQHLHDNHTPRP